jgi:hypothetical protein
MPRTDVGATRLPVGCARARHRLTSRMRPVLRGVWRRGVVAAGSRARPAVCNRMAANGSPVEPALQSRRMAYLSSIRSHGCGTAGPVYSARGRISRLLESCSSTWAVHPAQRLTAKIGVKSAVGMPSAW